MRRIGWRGGLTVGLIAGLAVGGSIAWAAIPNSTTGVITACYDKHGNLRVIDPTAVMNPTLKSKTLKPKTGTVLRMTDQRFKTCAKNETQLQWNQQGPPGGIGPPGVPGGTGPQGLPGTSDVAWVKVSVSAGVEVGILNAGFHCGTDDNPLAHDVNCSEVLPIGSTVGLRAFSTGQPNVNVIWGGDCAGQTGADCVLTLNSNKTVTAAVS